MVVLSEDTVKRFPNYFEGWDTLASIYEQTGRKELSIEPRKKSIELDPLNNELKRLLAADKN
jgi:cytochrome c-type biogenesis protein CcmH/NrfG